MLIIIVMDRVQFIIEIGISMGDHIFHLRKDKLELVVKLGKNKKEQIV